jgi:hypothetical protein
MNKPDETHSMYLAQRARGYRNSLICAGIALAGMAYAAASTFYSSAPEQRPAEPAAIVDTIDNKVEDAQPGNRRPLPEGTAAGIAISALGAAAAVKYAMDGVKADQNQFDYALTH